jgi:hypothetical protein
MLSLLQRSNDKFHDLLDSKLYDDMTFYPVFIKDLNSCGAELIIESPFVTRRRLQHFVTDVAKT